MACLFEGILDELHNGGPDSILLDDQLMSAHSCCLNAIENTETDDLFWKKRRQEDRNTSGRKRPRSGKGVEGRKVMIEGYLDQLNAQRKMLLILKAHSGYSAVVLDQTEYQGVSS